MGTSGTRLGTFGIFPTTTLGLHKYENGNSIIQATQLPSSRGEPCFSRSVSKFHETLGAGYYVRSGESTPKKTSFSVKALGILLAGDPYYW